MAPCSGVLSLSLDSTNMLSRWVQTDLGNIGANHFGFDAAPLGVAECAAGLDRVIAESTRETHGGKFYKWDGEVLPW